MQGSISRPHHHRQLAPISKLAVTLLLPAMCLPLAGQPAAVFEAETALMEIEVRVTDGSGRSIPDLSRDNFQLSENGREQTIATFEYVTRPSPEPAEPIQENRTDPTPEDAAADLRRSTFVYIATRGRREDRLRIHRAVTEFVDDNLAPGMLVSLNGTPFTSKRSELHGLLQDMLSTANRGRNFPGLVDTLAVDLARDDIQYSAAMQDILGEVNDDFSQALEEIADRDALYRRLRMYEYIDLIRALSIFPGRKVVVLFATGLPVDEENVDIMKVLQDEATKARVRFFVSDVSQLTASAPFGDAEVSGGFEELLGDVANNGFAMQAQNRQDNQDGLFELARRDGRTGGAEQQRFRRGLRGDAARDRRLLPARLLSGGHRAARAAAAGEREASTAKALGSGTSAATTRSGRSR